MVAPETIRIFEFSIAQLIAEKQLLKVFLNSTCNLGINDLLQSYMGRN